MFVPQRQRLGRPPGSSRRTRPRRGAGQQRERNPVATDQWINLDLLVGNLQYVILTWQFDVVSLFFEKHVRLSIGRWRVISKHGDINQDIQWEIVNQCAETSGCPLQHKGKKHQETGSKTIWPTILFIKISCKCDLKELRIQPIKGCLAIPRESPPSDTATQSMIAKKSGSGSPNQDIPTIGILKPCHPFANFKDRLGATA